ncbi:hypothetical protein E2C01_011323 [Portunus trituberculatus]|uniref:Uncharacterized protein n=1 Tax=Portunus trituberculatus TaxID=210409 RepID=A0A5B7DAR0_PORTR|nr:hypothetical protein [Portunus trituberculatus]
MKEQEADNTEEELRGVTCQYHHHHHKQISSTVTTTRNGTRAAPPERRGGKRRHAQNCKQVNNPESAPKESAQGRDGWLGGGRKEASTRG